MSDSSEIAKGGAVFCAAIVCFPVVLFIGWVWWMFQGVGHFFAAWITAFILVFGGLWLYGQYICGWELYTCDVTAAMIKHGWNLERKP